MGDSAPRLEVLVAVADLVNRHVELEPMLEGVLPALARFLDAKTAWVSLLEGDRFFLAATYGLPPALEADGCAAGKRPRGRPAPLHRRLPRRRAVRVLRPPVLHADSGRLGRLAGVGHHRGSLGGRADQSPARRALRAVLFFDNDAVGHQVVALEFENGVTAASTLPAFTEENTRTLKIMGTNGEIRDHLEQGRGWVVHLPPSRAPDVSRRVGTLARQRRRELMEVFVRRVRAARRGKGAPETSMRESIDSHLMALAAEKSRLEGGSWSWRRLPPASRGTAEGLVPSPAGAQTQDPNGIACSTPARRTRPYARLWEGWRDVNRSPPVEAVVMGAQLPEAGQ